MAYYTTKEHRAGSGTKSCDELKGSGVSARLRSESQSASDPKLTVRRVVDVGIPSNANEPAVPVDIHAGRPASDHQSLVAVSVLAHDVSGQAPVMGKMTAQVEVRVGLTRSQ